MTERGRIQMMRGIAIPAIVLLFLPAFPSDENPSPRIGQAPLWAKSAIWYQIFPERFRNGDPSNDPTPTDLTGSWPHSVPAGWQVTPWTSDWYELQPWERSDSKGFYFHAQNRRYGGDLQGVLDKLDYLKDLGITAIYFNPLFESPSLHKYDATMYHHIDNNFGSDPQGDRALWSSENPADPRTWEWSGADRLFLELIKRAHEKNIRVIVDGVFNHVGMSFWAFQDVVKNQQNSAFRDWFTVKQWDDPSTPSNEFDYEGWAGVRELPEVKKNAEGMAPSFEQHVKEIVKRWMDPNGDGNPSDGIDGWRLDVAEKVPIPFWKRFRVWVKEINPEAYIVGEVWWEDWSNGRMFNAAPWLQGDVFDAVMNYRWAQECFRFFAGQRTKITASEFSRRLENLLRDYPPDINFVLQNLYDSHDTDRLISHIVNTDALYDRYVDPNSNRTYDVRKPGERERATQKLMALFQMTYVGAPMIYYGTEAGMWGADDPDCRKPMLWPDYRFNDEKSHPFKRNRPADSNRYDQELFQWYSKLIRLRNNHPVLGTGAFEPILTRDESDILAFRRAEAGKKYVVVLNTAWATKRVTIPISYQQSGELTDLLSQRKYPVKNSEVTMTVEAQSGVVLQ